MNEKNHKLVGPINILLNILHEKFISFLCFADNQWNVNILKKKVIQIHILPFGSPREKLYITMNRAYLIQIDFLFLKNDDIIVS